MFDGPLLPVLLTKKKSGGGITSSDSDVTAWLSAVGAANTTQAEVNILTTMVAGLKSDGVWSSLDCLWLYGLGTAAAAAVDLVARASHTLVNSPTFTTQKGYTFDGSSSYIRTGYNPGAGGKNYVRDDAFFGVWVQTAANNVAFAAYAGVRSGATEPVSINLGSTVTPLTQYVWTINNGGGSTAFTFSTTTGLWTAERTASNASALYQNGSATGSTAAAASGAISNKEFLVGAQWDGGPTNPALFSNGIESAFVGGSHLGATKQGNLYTRMHTALNAINPTNFP